MEEYLEFAKSMAYDAGKIMLKYFNVSNKEDYKYDATIVTKADIEINQLLIKRVEEEYEDHSVDGEEEKKGESDYVWVCDPIDGTAMYARHVPTAVFSLALVINGIPEIGVIYDPFNDNLYSAIKGEKAFLNDKVINVNNYRLSDKESVANIDMWPNAEYQLYDVMKELGKETYYVNVGSVARACTLVAEGQFTAAIFPGTIGKNCDIAAAKVIVESSGGKVTDLFGNDQDYNTDINGAILSNGIVHEELETIIKKYLKNNR